MRNFNWQYFLVIVLGALMLCSLAFFNKFPLLYPDTAAYITSGFKGIVPNDRPIFYGLFLRHISLNENLWLVVFAQSLILSYLVFLFTTSVLKRSLTTYIGVLAILTVTTGVTLPAGQLVPDIFTPILLLAMGLVLFANLSIKHLVAVAIIIVVSILVHFSNVALGLVLLAFCWLLVWRRHVSLRHAWVVSSAVGLAMILIPSIHALFGGGFTYVKAGYLFRFNRLVELGVVDEYLRHNCDENQYVMCQYKDSIPTDFLWDPKSPLTKLGGWGKREEVYTTLIRDIQLSPKYWPKIALGSLFGGLQQFFNFEVYDARPINGPMVTDRIRRHFRHQYRASITSYQESQFERLEPKLKFLTNVSFVMCWLAFVALTLTFLYGSKEWKWVIGFVLFGILANAFITGTFSTVVPRYQNRIIWLAPFLIYAIYWPDWSRLNNLFQR